MKIWDWLRKKMIKFLGIEHLTENPKGERFTFISDEDEIIRRRTQEYKAWYSGESEELLNYYTEARARNTSNPVYNRNKNNYFWALSSTEANIKRVHSGIPNAIVSTLVNIIGDAEISTEDNKLKERIEKIISENDLQNIVNQQQMPLTLACGWGAFKVNVDLAVANTPLIEYYDAENVKFLYKAKKLVAIVYQDYIQFDGKDYLLLETRRTDFKNSYIDYELFKIEENNEVTLCELTDVPEVADYKNVEIANFPYILGVPSIYFYDIFNKNYGKSIFAGKVDLFDDLDQILSQDSQSIRLSTPVEYIPSDLLGRTKDGMPKLPNLYSRVFIAKETAPNGDGEIDGSIQTTQPQLNFTQYSDDAKTKLDYILTGILSPATLGVDVSKKDNAEAQREKEKITIMTRNNIISRQSRILKDILTICLAIEDYVMESKNKQEYDFSISYESFANPSFENQLETLGNALTNNGISPKKYVDLLWGKKLSEDEKQKEIAFITNRKTADDITFEELDNA